MGTNEVILQKLQMGIETTRGTAVPATRKMYAKASGKYEKPLQEFQDTTGTFFDRRRAAYARQKVSFTLNDIMTFEDTPYWLEHFIKGGVSGVTDADTPPAYTHTYEPTASTDNLKSSTIEFNESGNPYESNQWMLTTATMRMDADSDTEAGWMIDMEAMARGWAPTTFTAALPDRDTEVITARGTKFFIDDSGGTIGSTQKLGSLINASITIATGIHFKAFSEDETDYAPNKVGRQAFRVDAQLTVEFDSDVEFAKYRNSQPQQRLIRLSRDGSEINDAPTPKSFLVDLYGYWNSISFGDREGNLTATFGLSGFYDVSDSKLISIKIVNDAAAA